MQISHRGRVKIFSPILILCKNAFATCVLALSVQYSTFGHFKPQCAVYNKKRKYCLCLSTEIFQKQHQQTKWWELTCIIIVVNCVSVFVSLYICISVCHVTSHYLDIILMIVMAKINLFDASILRIISNHSRGKH